MKILSHRNKVQKVDKEVFMKKFEQVISDNFPGGIIILDQKGNIVSANKQYKNFFHIINHENIFKESFYIEQGLVKDFRMLLRDGTVVRVDGCHAVSSEGENKYLKIIAFPLRSVENKITGAISLFIDITESYIFRAKLLELNGDIEEIVRQRTEEIDQMNEELKNVIESKSVFMADVSHEFRTSLTIMQCSLELIAKQGNIAKDNLELFNNVITEIKRVSTTLADLTLLNRTDISGLKSMYKIIDLNSIIVSICKELKVVADEHNISIKYEQNDNPLEMLADKDQIERLLLNLVRNAIKYNVENGWVKVSTLKTKKGIYLYVEDGGIGIPRKELPHIFERFYRVDKSRTRRVGGSGLGLAICKHTVDMYDGKISVKSKVGEGSKFTVFFPIT